MSDIIGIETGFKKTERPACKVAYTLNNDQPVVCTIIGEQPLFYMDYEYDLEEEGLFDAAELGILENELLNVQKEIKSFENFSEDFTGAPDKAFKEFIENKEHFSTKAKADALSIEQLKEILAQSRLAEAYLESAAAHDVEIKFSNQVLEGIYDRKAAMIFINANLEAADQILICARELRRHWQHRQGALIHPLMFHPDNAVLVNRVQSADLAASVVRVAWELQLSNYKAAWQRIENSSMGDLGRAFAREAFLDFRTINNGQAASAVFESWFLSERCRVEDRKLIQNMLADYQGYVFDQDESEKSITPALIAALGTMPFGKNYLSAHVNIIMNDAIFTDVRDRSNANFLWFIKFEKSFRETEQELQIEGSDVCADDIAQAAFLKENQDIRHAAEPQSANGEIIELFPHFGSRKSGACKPSKNAKSAEIIYLR